MMERIRALFDGDLREINSYINDKNAAMLFWYISGPWITGRKDLVELKTLAVDAGTQILKEKISYSAKDYQLLTHFAIGFFAEILKLDSTAFVQSQKTFDVFENINQLLDQCLTHEEINLLARSYPPNRLLRQTVYEKRSLIQEKISKKRQSGRRKNLIADQIVCHLLSGAEKRFQQLQRLEVIYLTQDGSYIPENELDKLKLYPSDYNFSPLSQPPLPFGFEPLVPPLKPVHPDSPLEWLLKETKKHPVRYRLSITLIWPVVIGNKRILGNFGERQLSDWWLKKLASKHLSEKEPTLVHFGPRPFWSPLWIACWPSFHLLRRLIRMLCESAQEF